MTTYAKGIQVIRDEAIMEDLYWGPADVAYLHNKYFKKEDGTLVSTSTFFARMDRLCEMEYVKKKFYKTNMDKKMIYAIDNRGVIEMCNKHNFNPDEARIDFPSQDVDLIMPLIAKQIRSEFKQNKYDILSFPNPKFYKGIDLPNLRVQIMPPHKTPIQVDIYFDLGQKLPPAATPNTVSLVVSQNDGRLRKTKQCLPKSNPNIGLALLSDFLHGGLVNTKWDWPSRSSSETLEIDN
jgi:hypothetical protein